MDGLIIDTESPDYAVWRDVLSERGFELPMRLWSTCIGTYGGIDGVFETLGVPDDVRQDARAVKRDRYRAAVAAAMVPLPGFPELFGWLRSQDVQCAVVSTSSPDWVEFVLGGLAIADAFDFVLSGGDVARGKPHPDLYELAVRKAGSPIEECIAFEDSANGVLAASRAGVSVVAVPNTMTEDQDFSRATARVSSLEHVDGAFLRSLGYEVADSS